MANTNIKAGMFYGVVGHGTDGYFLMSNGDGSMAWGQASTGPSVTSVTYPGDDTAADPAGGQTVVLTGTGFATSGMTVTIGGTAAPSVAHTSNTQLTITTPAKAAGDYDIVVTNGVTGASGTFVNGISYNGVPTWTTAAGSLGTFESSTTISTITLQAIEPDGGTITFNITNGALPTGLSLSGANINGTTTAETSTTLYSFTIEAIDDENQSTPRNFSITVNAALVNTDAFDIITYTGTGGTYNVGDGQDASVYVNYGSANYAWSSGYQSSGKWYWEVKYIAPYNNSGHTLMVGIVNVSYSESWTNANTKMYYAGNGQAYTGGSGTSYGATYQIGDIISVLYDADNRTLTFWKNGTSQGTAFTGLNTTYPNYRAAIGTGLYEEHATMVFDANDFTYTMPAGYSAFPGGTMSVSGGGVMAARSANPTDFQPDLVWIKDRGVAGSNHVLSDSVRGVSKFIIPNLTNAEITSSGGTLSSFNSNGFTLAPASPAYDFNINGNSYVAWCWKAGGTAVSNTDGSITSTVSANQAAGFSIVQATTAGAGTIGHGLSESPQLIITKLYEGASSWNTYSEPTGASKFLHLDATSAATTSTTRWNNTAPTTSVFSLGSDFGSGNKIIAYCFHSVDGYQKIGSYTGNGSSSGQTITGLGFNPRFLLVKNATNSAAWRITDKVRGDNIFLYPNSSSADDSNSGYISLITDGFRMNGLDSNTSDTFIYLAIA